MERIIALKASVLLVLTLSVLSSGCISYQMVRFETIPEKADIYVNGIPQGKTPVTVKLLTDAAGTDFSHRRHSIVARIDGYEDEKLVLQSPSYFLSNTKPFPETITLKLRKIRSDAYSEEEPKQQADENALPLKKYATGSGFIVSGEGHVLSNYHIVNGCREIRLPPTTVEVLAQDKQSDLVLLKIPQRSATFATFREGRGVRAGESIVVVGYPLHGVLSSEPNITTGVVSALAGPDNDRRLIQITAPVQPGNSGGPLLDQSGNIDGKNLVPGNGN